MSWTKIETADQALELLERAVATRGEDFVYEKRSPESDGDADAYCVYFYKGQPDCLIGVALSMVGWTERELASNHSADTLHEGYPGRLTADVAEVLGAAQLVQDKGRPWGAALAEARRVAAYINLVEN